MMRRSWVRYVRRRLPSGTATMTDGEIRCLRIRAARSRVGLYPCHERRGKGVSWRSGRPVTGSLGASRQMLLGGTA
jgi:hypothetical protein